MSPFADVRFRQALSRLEAAIGHLEDHRDLCAPSHLATVALAAAREAKGHLVAVRQLIELEDAIADGVADTERPSHLRVIK